MKRRDFLKLFAALPFVGTLGNAEKTGAQEIPAEFAQGWIPNPRATEEFCRTLPHIYSEQVEALVKQDNNRAPRKIVFPS